MAHFIIGKDYETSERAGAGGMYQIEVLRLSDENGDDTDVTHKIDMGLHFSMDDQTDLWEYLANTFNFQESDIDIDEI